MAKRVLLAEHVSLNGNDLSAYVSSAELSMEIDEQDATTFASGGWNESLGGLGSGSLSLTFKQDFDAGAVDDLLWPLFTSRTPVPFAVRADQAAVSAANPEYRGMVLLNAWTPIAGDVGDIAEADVEWPTSGPVSRAVT